MIRTNLLRLGILGSTRGTGMLEIVSGIRDGRLQAKIEMVISNRCDALILERAKSLGLQTTFVDPQGLSRPAYDQKISDLFRACQIDLILLIGYMRILSPEFVRAWKNKIMNVHPSLLPAFAGKMDLDVHKAVLAASQKETGCTVHYVTEDVDAGPIIVQKKCPVLEDDTAETLKMRVQALEGNALIEAIQMQTSLNLLQT